MIIFRYALLRGIRHPMSLLCNCLLPLVLMLIRPLWSDGDTFGFALITFVAMSGAYLMSQSIITDKTDGAITRILTAPVTMRRYLVENLFACMVPLLVQTILIALLGFWLYNWTLTLSFAVFLCYTILTLASVAMAFAWHCLFKNKESSAAGFTIVLVLTAILGGLTFPAEFFPGPLQYLGAIFPAYWAMRGIRSAAEVGYLTNDYWLAIAAMMLFATAYLLYGGKRRII